MDYNIPPDTREKEKIFGGMFTLTQTIFLVLAVVCGGGAFLLTFSLIGLVPSLILGMIVAIPFVPFAFIKVESCGNVELFEYLIIMWKYNQSQKVYINLNENYKKLLIEKGGNA